VGELDLRAIANVRLDLLPAAIFGVNFFARSTDGQEARQGIQFGDSFLQFGNDTFFLGFGLYALGNVAAVAAESGRPDENQFRKNRFSTGL
jgi:hypothetical protein